jgi:hypothetical protein
VKGMYIILELMIKAPYLSVSLHKRAQILIGDIWACFQGEGLGAFDDIDTITMFADYRYVVDAWIHEDISFLIVGFVTTIGLSLSSSYFLNTENMKHLIIDI